MENLTKVRFELEDGDVLGGETAWAERVGEGLYRLRNSPFSAWGYSWGDVVRCVDRDGWPTVVGVEEHGGSLTVRILFARDFDDPTTQHVIGELKLVGCSYEAASRHLVTVDVPPSLKVPFSQMTNYLNGLGTDVIEGWEIAKGPNDLPEPRGNLSI